MRGDELAKAVKLIGWAKLIQVIVAVVVLVAVIFGGFYIISLRREVAKSNAKLEEMNRSFLRLSRAVRARSVAVSDLRRTIKDWRVNPEVLRLIRKNREEITLVGKLVAEMRGTRQGISLAPISGGGKPEVKEFSSEIRLPDGPPIAWWRVNTLGKAEQGIYPFELHLLTTLSRQSSGGFNLYNELYLTLPGDPVWKDKRYPLPIKSSEVRFISEERRGLFFSPALDIGLDIGVKPPRSAGIGYSLGFSLLSYGRRSDCEWRFFRFSLGALDDGLSIGFSPVSYNIGDLLPLVQDLWFSLGINHRGAFLFTLSTVF